MKLNQILKQITPLPWSKLPAVTSKPGGKQMGANQRYGLHAANVLPELLAAAKNLQDNWEHNLTEPMARLNDAIELAETLNEEEVYYANGTHHR